MGGLLRTPRVPAAPQPAPAAAPAQSGSDADPAELARRRRGMVATIATSDRGLADSRLPVAPRKALLGE